MKTLIKNAWILTMDKNYTEYHPGYLVFEDGIISEIGNHENCPEKYLIYIQSKETLINDELLIIDAQDGILIPGMINAHTHVGMIPFRGLGDDMPDRLRKLLFPLEEILDKTIVQASAKYALAEMVLSGITCFADMYYFEDEIAEITKEMKMRAVLGETIIHHPTCDGDENPYFGLKISPDFIESNRNNSLIQPMLAPHATNTNNEETLRLIGKWSKKYQVPVMMHVSEMDYELDFFKEEFQMTPIQYLNHIGLLNEKLLAVHCIHLTDEDIHLIKQHNVSVIHCIGANLKAGKGIMPLKKLLQANVPIALGTDGPSSGNTLDLFTLMKTMAYVHKTNEKDRSFLPARELVYLATQGGAKVLGIDHKVGHLAVGMSADLTLIETQSVNMFPNYDPYNTIVYSARANNVSYVWVNGNCLVAKKQLTNCSLEEIKDNLQQAMKNFIIYKDHLLQA